MSDQPASSPRTTLFLVITLVILVAFIGVLLCLIVLIPVLTRSEPTPTPTLLKTLVPTFTLTASPTSTLTPTATFTYGPTPTPTVMLSSTITKTPTPTLTGTGLPTLTPAKALPLAASYDLAAWTPDQADYLIRLLDGYPDTLPAAERGPDQSAYFGAYQFAVVAEKEALLRYPDASQAEDWRWKLAFDLARTGDGQAGEEYASLILEALNGGASDLENLYIWFQEQEPRLALYMIGLEPPPTYSGSYLVELRGDGSTFIWLLATARGYQAYVLATNFDFVNQPQASWIVTELDGDPKDGKEVAIYFSTPSDQFQLDAPRVFSLGLAPPREMSFLPAAGIFNVGMEYDNQWIARSNPQGSNDLAFQTDIFPACPVSVHRAYRWNGFYFSLVDEQYQLTAQPLDSIYCQTMIDQAYTYWGPQAAIHLMEELLPALPPAVDANGNPMPLDAKDEWRFRLGVYHALIGQEEFARSYLEGLVNQPSIPASRWIAPARLFLQAYQLPVDIYQACLTTELCDPMDAMEFLVATLPPDVEPLVYLRQHGLTTDATGYFDFDGDKQSERWFTMRNRPLEKLQFCILAAFRGGMQVLNVSTVDARPPSLVYLDPAYVEEETPNPQPVDFLDGRLAFRMLRLPDTRAPYLQSVPLRAAYPDRFQMGVDQAEKNLFSGMGPRAVRDDLKYLATFPGLLCKNTWSCDRYYYLLGLASDLAGDQPGAVEAYHRLWLDYSKSPYTTMARLKLAGMVYLSPTPSPSATLTASRTLPASLTPSPSVTGTPPTATLTRTPTPTPTPTPTITGTPPTATPTGTPTPTGTLATATSTPVFTLVELTSPVNLGANAKATIQTSPGVTCTISYIAPNGIPSTVSGLGDKTADDPSGRCTWTWRIGGYDTIGTGNVTITVGSYSQVYDIEITGTYP